MQKTQKSLVRSLGQEDSLEKEMATHSSILALEIPWTEEPGSLQSMGSQSQTWLSTHTHTLRIHCLGISSLHFSSVTQSCPTFCDPMGCSTPGFPVHHQLLMPTQTHVHHIDDAIQQSHPLSTLVFNLSQHQGLFKWVSSSHQVAKVLEFQLQHQSFQWIFRIDWLYLLAVQGTLKNLLQHSSKAWILCCLAFFIVQLSHLCMTTGKTIPLTKQTFVGEIMSLLFNMLSRLVIAFLPMSKHLLISWLQSPSAVILEPPKIKSVTVSTVSHLFDMKWWDWMPWS